MLLKDIFMHFYHLLIILLVDYGYCNKKAAPKGAAFNYASELKQGKPCFILEE